jgi:uncharacterized OB-fold protein
MTHVAAPNAVDDADPAEGFFGGARVGVLRIQRCEKCGALQCPLPGLNAGVRFCRTCAAPRPAWIDARGSGKIVSFTILPARRGKGDTDDPPRVAGIVELEEGPWLQAALDMTPEEAGVGVSVEVAFREGIEPDRPVPVFRRA